MTGPEFAMGSLSDDARNLGRGVVLWVKQVSLQQGYEIKGEMADSQE